MKYERSGERSAGTHSTAGSAQDISLCVQRVLLVCSVRVEAFTSQYLDVLSPLQNGQRAQPAKLDAILCIPIRPHKQTNR